MGVPKFFRWLSERYPLINQTVDLINVGPIIGTINYLHKPYSYNHIQRRKTDDNVDRF